MEVSQVINLVRTANNYLPSVQHRHEKLQEHNNRLESILKTRSKQLQHLDYQIISSNKSLGTIKSEYRREVALLQGLQQHTVRLEGIVYNYKNNNEEYSKLMENIENKVNDYLSDKDRQ